MKLSYLPIQFTILFEKPAFVDSNILFVLRSVIGKNLHELSCVAENQKCQTCLFNKNCLYAFLFDKYSTQNLCHPFAFTKGSNPEKETISEYAFEITLFGKAIEQVKTIISVIEKIGKDGIFRKREKFSITNCKISVAGQLISVEEYLQNPGHNEWNSTTKIISKTEFTQILLQLKSPLRFKVGGTYPKQFSAEDLLHCFYRRAKNLCSQYGEMEENEKGTSEIEFNITERNLFWKEGCHFSARQKTSMELGGYIGSITLEGKFSNEQLALLELNRIANAGKNTVFGLGQIDYWIK